MGGTEMTNEVIHINENEYKEILLQTVAVIETARSNIARHVAATASNTYWEIGKILYDRKLESKHGSGVVKRLSVDLWFALSCGHREYRPYCSHARTCQRR